MEEIALGKMNMSVDEFYDMTPKQFANKQKGYNARVEFEQREDWERARWIAYFAIKGHDAKNRIKSPEELFKIPGDSKKEKHTPPPMTREEALRLAEKWK